MEQNLDFASSAAEDKNLKGVIKKIIPIVVPIAKAALCS